MKISDPKELRLKRKLLQQKNRSYKTGVFVEIPRSEWPPRLSGIPIVRVMRSREFLVQIFEGEYTRLSICRTELNKQGDWKDGISWDEMQSIKDGCGYADCDAVEAHPKMSDIVNIANMRHLWIVPADYSKFFWRDSKIGSGFASSITAGNITGII